MALNPIEEAARAAMDPAAARRAEAQRQAIQFAANTTGLGPQPVGQPNVSRQDLRNSARAALPAPPAALPPPTTIAQMAPAALKPVVAPNSTTPNVLAGFGPGGTSPNAQVGQPVAASAPVTAPSPVQAGNTTGTPYGGAAGFLQRALPSSAGELASNVATAKQGTGVGERIGSQIAAVNNADAAFFNDTAVRPVMGAVNAVGGAISGVYRGLTGQTTAPPLLNATNKPGDRVSSATTAASPSAPIAPVAPVAPAPGAPGSIEQMGGQTGYTTPKAPVVSDPRLQSLNNASADRGSGISATRQANGTLAFTNVGADGTVNQPTKPQSFNGSGWDQGANNAREIAGRERDTKIGMQGAIASLVSRARETNDPRQEKELLAQASQLQGGLTQDAGAIAQAGAQAANAGLATAQTGAVTQTTAQTAASAKKLDALHDQYINAKTPEEAKVLGDKLLVMAGKNPSDGKFTHSVEDELNDPTNPMMGTHKVAYIMDNTTGVFQRAKDAAAAGKLGGAVPAAGPAGKFEEGKKYVDPETGKTRTYRGGKFVD